MAHPYSKQLRSRCSRKPEVSGKREAWSKSSHKSLVFTIIQTRKGPNCWDSYWIELATLENTVLEFEPIRRTVPTTRTKITANITAYSAMSCPESSDQSLRISFDMFLSSRPPSVPQRRTELELGGHHDARGRRLLSMRVFQLFTTKSIPRNGCCWLGLRGIHRA